ncbi:MAG: YafY family transcriptional regulator [Defluviitaleaceae bacterium]|nr:YafY family transcriptional regulator [Defluviitaleaceae bacterium]
MQVNRLFEIIYLLLNKKRVTAKELAERFEVSTRTIYRDIDTISLAGIPIYTEKGKGGGISLLPDFVLNKSLLSDEEQNEILLALQGLSHIQSAENGQVLQKLSAIFNKTAANWLEVDFSDWSFANGDIFNNFKTAILERRVCEFDYYSTYGEKTHRKVEPVQLWFKAKAWYLKAFCLRRQDMRLFKLTRVRNLTVHDEVFHERDLLGIPPSPDPPRPQKQDVFLRLKIAPEMAYHVYGEYEWDVEEVCDDGSFIVSTKWLEDNWMYGVILSFGEYMEVLEPSHIREIIKEKGKKIWGKYL